MSNINKRTLREAAEGNVKYAQMFINPHDVLALLDDLEAAEKYITKLREWNVGLAQESFERQRRVVELEAKLAKPTQLRKGVI